MANFLHPFVLRGSSGFTVKYDYAKRFFFAKARSLKFTNKTKFFASLLTGLLFVLISSSASAQLGVYAFTGTATCPAPATSVTTQPANAVFSNYSSVGATCVALANGYQTSNWNTTATIDLNEYNQFTITPNTGYLLTLTTLSFNHQTSANSASTTTWALRSSIDNFATNISTGTATTTSQTPSVALPAASFTNVGAVTFRLYLYKASATTTTWRNDNITLSGSVNAIPANPGNPTSNSPQCASPGVTLTRPGTPPVGITWFWQTTATGTSTTNSAATYNVTTPGTYYIRARNNTSLIWSNGTGSVTVAITPNVGTPSFTAGTTSTRCQGADAITYDATATNTTGVTYTLDAASITGGNTIEPSTGLVTFAAGWSGSSTITATAAGCSPRSSTHIVNTTSTVGTPIFTLGATSARCQTAETIFYVASATNNTGIAYSLDAASVAAGNSINVSTGAVTYTSAWYGTSVITATASGCNGTKSSNHTVTTNQPVTALAFTNGSTSMRCQSAGSVTYTATATNTTGIAYTLDAASLSGGNSINSATGVVTYASTWFGITTITATAAGCTPQSVIHTVTTTATVGLPVFSMGTTSSRCQAAGTVTYAATATNNTGITYTLDATSLAANNTIDPSNGIVTYDATWVGVSVITATATGCNGPRSSSHTVTTNAPVTVPVFTAGTSTRCQGASTTTYTATASNTTGTTYSLDATSIAGNNSINAATGAVTFAAGWYGTTVITASAAGCYGPQTATYTVTTTATVSTPVFSMGTTSTRCQGAEVVMYDATATTTTGITYSLNAASITGGCSINATTGEVTYPAEWSGTTIITASAAGCNGPKTATHTVTVTPTVGTPVFALGVTSTRCQNSGTVLYTATATSSTSRTYALDDISLAAGNIINASTGAVTYASSWTGTSVITVTATGCNGPAVASHTVTITPSVTAIAFTNGSTSTRCQSAGSVTYTATATNTTGITYTLDAASRGAGNTINATTGVVTYVAGWSGTSTVTATAAGCTPQSITHTVTTTATVGLPVFSMGAKSMRCAAAESITYTATATNNTGITYTLDATSLAAGNTIDSTTGEVTYNSAWSGLSTITATATGCNGPRSSSHIVTTNAPVTEPVFAMGDSSSRCQGLTNVIYTATASNTSGNITYSLDAISRSYGNKIKAATGEVTFDPGWTGTSIVTASAPGCPAAQTSTHTITTIPYVGMPVFAMGSTSTRCQGAGTVAYTATATNTTGITYSLNAASITAGNTINATTGEVTFVAGWTGSTIITASAAGCSGPATKTHTVTITPTVGIPVFTSGAASTRCQNAGTVIYTATATNSTSRIYSLDNASIAAGNYINPATGAVSYTAEWVGTSVVTVTAQGCNGPATATHTVTITASVETPVFALGTSSTRCRAAGSVSYTATAENATAITYTLDATSRANGNTINATTGVVTYTLLWTGTSTITANATGCNGPETATHTVTTNPPVTTPVFALGASSTRCQGAGTTTYTATASNTSGITYTLDAASIAAGNTINTATGAVTYAATWAGKTIITASAAGCFGPLTASHTVTITSTVAAPVFAAGTATTRCNGAGTVIYTATAATTITYTLDAATIAGGNTINSSTGAVNYVAGWVGKATITARAAGCGTPSTIHTATSTPSVAAPVFTLGATSTRCQSAGNVTYSAASANSTGISFSLDATSTAAGNAINTSTGQVTYVADWKGSSVITATAIGCNGPVSSNHTVTTTGNGTPDFVLGTNSTRLQAAGSVTYTATANNGNPVTYRLDTASLNAGNTINATTGVVTYVATWSGTTIITATAPGCNGPASSIHTVTITPSSVIKQLYLSDPSQSLDRIDPVATGDVTTANTVVLNNGSTTTFTQNPALCSQLIIKTGGKLSIQNYITVTSGSMPPNPAITAVLRYGATIIFTLTNPTYSSATGLLTWSITPAADATIPAGQAISLDIKSLQPGVSFTINYDSQNKPSKINLPVSTYINITSLNVYNAPYPGGTVITGAVTGSTNYVRAVVTDPFGFNDITALDLTITPTGNTVSATSVATSGCSRTYQYVWNSPATPAYYQLSATAKEGFENTVTFNKTIVFSNCTSCPPMAIDDSASGDGGAPLLINVLANDIDPNNNINPASLSIVTLPRNGNVVISNGQIIYLPNGTFTGTDDFTYQICDLTTPTPLCATANVKVFIDPTIVDACSETSQSHTYYIPYPEQDARTALIASTNSAYLPIPSSNIRTIISMKIPYPGTVIRWDHWEDGYEANILSPTQSTTKVWGDGNPFNGIAPGYSNDIIPAGGSLVFDNTMNANPRSAATIMYDGRDKIVSTGEVSITQVLGEPSIIGLQAMKTNVSSTNEFGKSFTIPVGQNFNSQDFRYTALFIRAAENNTLVSIDKDNNGTFETTATLNQGQSLLVNGGVMTGATVTGSAPIGVDLHFGGVDGYSSREVPIYPATWYSNVYYTPVPTTQAPDTSVVMLYNNLNRDITINWTSGAPASGSILLPAKTVKRFALAVSATNTYKFVNPTGESFTAIEIVDSYTPGTGTNSGSTFDWAFNLISEDRLTTFATIAWAPGSTDGSRNDNPIWVTPAANTTVYVKYDGNVLAGGSVSPCGLHYNVAYTLNALKYKKIFDTDNDQSGIAIYTCDGTKIAAVYGEDPVTAADANPSWDVGTTIKPYCATKLIFANDDYAYSLTDRAVTIPVLENDAGFTAVIDPSSLVVGGFLLSPKHGTVSVNPNGTLLYKPNAGYIGSDTLQYRVCSTPAVVCDEALVIIKISGCPTPVNQNIISGQVFLDKNKDGVRNDGNEGFTPAKVYLYVDGNCNGTIDINELKDSVSVDSSGSYQFISYPEKTIADDFDSPTGTNSCATGSDGNTPWASSWVDAGDPSVGFCATPTTYANTDAEIVLSGGSYALRLKDNNVSATRTANLSGATAALLSFTYRRATAGLVTGQNVQVQASANGTSFTTIFTITGNGKMDTAKVNVYNLDIAPYASTTTYIRFLTNANMDDADEVYIDDVSITFLKYPTCYITRIDTASIPNDYFVTTATKNNMTAGSGGTCLFPFDFGVAKSIITVSGTLYNDANGLTDNLVNGTGTGAPSGNTMYAYLVDTSNKIVSKATVSSISGAYSFTNTEVNTAYTISLSTIDSPVLATVPSTNGLPSGWVSVGDAYGSVNKAGTGNEAGIPDCSIPLSTGLFSITGVNFGIERIPSSGSGINSAINPGGVINITVPANTFTNIIAGSDPTPGVINSIRITSFPTNANTITINGVSYTALTFPAAGIKVPANSSGQPTQTITIDPVDGFVRIVIPFYVIDNAGVEATTAGTAVIQLLLDTDRDGIADINDIDDDNDGIIDWIEVCGNGATGFTCTATKTDPAKDDDGDGIVNWQDADYGTLNANGCVASLDSDGDGVPDFLDLDSDNDGIPDVVEAFGADANGDGVIDNFTDTDGDGLSQNLDANNTGAVNSGNGLGFVDFDKDGVPNTLDLDSDNDGIPDIIEAGDTDIDNNGIIDSFTDTDGDGLDNIHDGDADNNGTIENTSGPTLKTGADTNSNGKPDSYPNKNNDLLGYPNPYDLDADGDGITDAREAGFPGNVVINNGMINGSRTNGWANTVRALVTLTLKNTDARGAADYLDIDSDDDGIGDNIEGQPTFSYKVPSDVDTDNDGLADVYEIGSVGTFGGGGITPYDHDADGTPDYMDLDTDNDGAPDINEASQIFTLNQSNINTNDTDGDGMVDQFDNLNIKTLTVNVFYKNVANNNIGPSGDFNGPLPTGSNVKIVRSNPNGSDRDFRNTAVLPILITSLKGSMLNNNVILVWNVTNEQQVYRYLVERSTNGVSFASIGSVPALNSNNSTYNFNDDIAGLAENTFYYRIKQVDLNGNKYNTQILVFKKGNVVGDLRLIPNPTETLTTLSFSSPATTEYTLSIRDGSGRILSSRKIKLTQGINQVVLEETRNLAGGVYTVQLIDKDSIRSVRLIKLN